MGGSLNMVFRDENGKTEFRQIWTSGMYDIQGSYDIIEKKNLIPQLDEWYGRDEVFESDKIHPSGYGLFVVDYLKNEMYSIQGYCGTGNYYSNPWDSFYIGKSESDVLLRFIRDNRIKSVEYFVMGRGDEKGKFAKATPTKEQPLTENYIKDIIRNQNANFTLDLSPIQVIEFADSKVGYRNMKKHMLKSGFGIDEKAWKEFIRENIDY